MLFLCVCVTISDHWKGLKCQTCRVVSHGVVKHGPKAQSVPGRDPPQSSATVSRLGSCANWQFQRKKELLQRRKFFGTSSKDSKEEVPKIRRRLEDIQVGGGTLEVDSKIGSSKWRFLRSLEGWGCG